MSEKSKKNAIYMETFRSQLHPAIAANVFKEYDAEGNPSYYYKLSRAWKAKNSAESGYSGKFYIGFAEAIAEVAELADMTIRQVQQQGFVIGRHLTKKLSEKLTESQLQSIAVEKYREIEDDFLHIKERGEDRFWETVINSLVERE